ncbi:hypothetical protein KUTeg_020048 [Tegillarca granosa]|uniref:Protein kinase domain-containing protein n=1 Tax=Tegillarca granosa TaxID=220873 RepID=A0ABQ9EB71_TEGGR|nr:hypothetical protein KUTeg_020048 [Tegillarca granosa]
MHRQSLKASFRTNSEAKEIKEEDILNLEDYDDAWEYAEELGGLNDLEETKERLLMHIRKGETNPKQQIEAAMMRMYKEDEQKRLKLTELLNETKETLAIFQVENNQGKAGQRGSAAIEGLLKTEGATKDLALDFNSRLESVKSGECMVVVSGETSAGKSTVLNLLLEENILPTHTLSCTSVVTKIAYGTKRRAEIIYVDKSRPSETLILDKDHQMEQLKRAIYVENVDNRLKATEIQEVKLFLPSNILKSGLVFVDTPGIGENDAMDEVITRFVDAHHIMGFIYLINLIKLILEHQKQFCEGEGNISFDPKSAIFLCNLWDTVKKEEADVVYDNAVNKLSQCWPSLSPSQVIRLSAKKAQAELKIDPDYIKEDYKLTLEGIKDIHHRAVDGRVKKTYKWIENILLRSAHHLKTLVRRLDSSERDLEDKMKQVFEKLEGLRKRSDCVLEDMNTRIRAEAEDIYKQFRQYLRSPASRIAITNWIEDELPSKDDNTISWIEVKNKIGTLVSLRITEQLEKWEQSTRMAQSLENKIMLDIRAQLHLLQDDLTEIEEDIQEDDNASISSEEEFTTAHRDRGGRRQTLPAFRSPVSSLSANEAAIPLKILTRAKNPMIKFLRDFRRTAIFDDIILARKLKQYRENPCIVAKQRTEKILNSLLEDQGSECLFLFVEGLLYRPKQYLKSLKENIPALVQSNEDLMNHIAMCRVDASDSRSLYIRMMEDMEKLRRRLIEYGQGNIFVDDFMGEDIFISKDIELDRTSTFKVSDMVLDSSSRHESMKKGLPRGLWTAFQNGYVTKDGIEKSVSMRIYLPSARIESTYPEIARLRCLHHEHVAEFLGVHHSDSPIQAFVYDNHLKSLRQFIKSGFSRLKQDLPRIVNEVANGIEYLHRKKMVHMELNTNTITVTSDGDVKLTGGCLPRLAAFPFDKEAIEVGEFVYLSPEVLMGELYIACADIYALGLLLFELFVDRPFSAQRKWKLDHFSSKVNPKEMLDLEMNLTNFSESTKNLINWCLSIDPNIRPSTQIFLQNVQEIKQEMPESYFENYTSRLNDCSIWITFMWSRVLNNNVKGNLFLQMSVIYLHVIFIKKLYKKEYQIASKANSLMQQSQFIFSNNNI